MELTNDELVALASTLTVLALLFIIVGVLAMRKKHNNLSKHMHQVVQLSHHIAKSA